MSLPFFQLSDGRVLRHTLDGRAFESYMFGSTFGEKIPLIGARPASLRSAGIANQTSVREVRCCQH
jgi:hypothetical protein